MHGTSPSIFFLNLQNSNLYKHPPQKIDKQAQVRNQRSPARLKAVSGPDSNLSIENHFTHILDKTGNIIHLIITLGILTLILKVRAQHYGILTLYRTNNTHCRKSPT